MKTPLLLIATCLAVGITVAQDQVIIEDFDTNRNLNSWTGSTGNYFVSTATGPGSANDTVGLYDLNLDVLGGGSNWIGTRVNGIMGNVGPWGGYDVDTYPFYTIDVYSDSTFNLGMKIEDGANGDPKPTIAEVYIDYSTPGAWQTMEFDLSSAIGLGSDNELVFLMDLWNTTSEKIIYLNNFTAHKSGTVTGIPSPSAASQNSVFPNPATSQVTIKFNVPSTTEAVLSITNLMGQIVLTKDLGELAPGAQSTALIISDLTPGLYHYSINNTSANLGQKILID